MQYITTDWHAPILIIVIIPQWPSQHVPAYPHHLIEFSFSRSEKMATRVWHILKMLEFHSRNCFLGWKKNLLTNAMAARWFCTNPALRQIQENIDARRLHTKLRESARRTGGPAHIMSPSSPPRRRWSNTVWHDVFKLQQMGWLVFFLFSVVLSFVFLLRLLNRFS
jgi:hypothetical protein